MTEDPPQHLTPAQQAPEVGSAAILREGAESHVAPWFSPAEMHLLTVFWSSDTPLTAGQIGRQTGASAAEVAETLTALRSKRLVCALNTVIESYQATGAPTKVS